MNSFIHYLKQLWFAGANLSDETLAPDEKVREMGFIYSIYRILVSLFLIMAAYTMNKSGEEIQRLILLSDNIKQVTLIGYASVSVILFVVFCLQKKRLRHQLLIGFLIDMIALSLLLYSGGATDLQTVLLYMVVIASSFMLLKLSRAVIVTFLAILSLIYQQLYIIFSGQTGFLSLTDTVMLSLCLLAVGFLSWSVSQRLSAAEATAQNDARQIAHLSTINQAVIKNMTDGILVTSRSGRLIMINKAAEDLLALALPAFMEDQERIFEAERLLNAKEPELCAWYKQKDSSASQEFTTMHGNQRNHHLRISKRRLPEHGQLLIVEDIMRERTHAQQLKLASLGQLTASIAHEVRNPLGAISQASQILMEDDDLESNPNKELYEMIYYHSKRVNRIIEDIMRLSRQEPPKQEIIDISDWLKVFLAQHFESKSISVHLTDQYALLAFDPHHLEQIFINLIHNALRHTIPTEGVSDVQIVVHSDHSDIMIDVIDNGTGVGISDQEHLFNPFFTTSKGGTGLGLYLSLAFSEANQAKLIYVKEAPKTCFRLISAKSNVDALKIELA